jgi:hypothetical protein
MSSQDSIRDEMCGIGYLITISQSTVDVQDLLSIEVINYEVITDDGYEFTLTLPGIFPEVTNDDAFKTIKEIICKISEKSDWIKDLKLKKDAEIIKKEQKKLAKKK